MPGESSVAVTPGAGRLLHTWQTTISAQNVEDEFVVPGEYPYPTYVARFIGISGATAGDHLISINAGASLKLRIRKVVLREDGAAAAAAASRYELLRLTTLASGGGALTANALDPADAASGVTAQTLPTVKGTEGASIGTGMLILRQAVSATQSQYEGEWVWTPPDRSKSLVIPSGTANGVCLKNVSARAGVTLSGEVWWVETSF